MKFLSEEVGDIGDLELLILPEECEVSSRQKASGKNREAEEPLFFLRSSVLSCCLTSLSSSSVLELVEGEEASARPA